MSTWQILQHLIFGMFLGGVIGIEREKSFLDFNGKFAGARTYTLIGLLGVLLGLIEEVSVILFAGLLAGYLGLIIASYIVQSLKNKQIGGTSEVASLLVLISGYFVGKDNYTIASMIIMATAFLLYSKEKIREFAKQITAVEMKSVIQFVTIAFIVLPLLPNASFGPFSAWNPYVIWTMIVIISGISFLSYIAVKLVGTNKGISLSGFLGGLVSSTAVTLAFSQKSKKYKNVVNPFVFGILIAGTAMFFRIFLEVFVVNKDLVPYVAIPLLTAGGTGLLLSIWFWWRQMKESKKAEKLLNTEEIDLGKPLDLVAAIKFGAVFALVLLVAKFMQANFGEEGIYLTSIVSGLVDTDAITVSLANMVKNGSLEPTIAGLGITLATLSNTFVKGIFVLALGSRAVAIRTMLAFLIIAAASLSSFLF